MSGGYILTQHARARIAERGITPDALAGALAGERWRGHGGAYEYFLDTQTRLLIVACHQTRTVLTAYRLTRRQIRRRKQVRAWAADVVERG